MTPRQLKFCRFYAATGNGADAARRAGYAAISATVAANRLLKRTKIQEQIKAYSEKYAQQEDLDTGALLRELISITEMPSIGSYLTQTDDGEVVWKDPSELTAEQLAAIKQTVPIRDVMQDQWSSIELHDKAAAVSTLIDMVQPAISSCQRESIVSALTRLGSQRGFTATEINILTNALYNPEIASEGA